ncbi:MAG TPA: methyltransferase, partial [Desulfuromonadales bacterium]|nr:methyltransferase [Desulfuromonadales bacterium]
MQDTLWTLPKLMDMSGCYWSACTLHAGVELDVFTPLAEAPASAAELAERLDLDERGLTMLLDALAALELLDKQKEIYRTTPFAGQYLAADSPEYLGHIIRHHHHLVESWARLDEAVRTGQPSRHRVSHDAGEKERESFLLGMLNLAMLLAPQVTSQIDLGGRRHLLDLGGGPGTYAIHFCLHNPGLRASIFDLPSSREIAERTIRQFDLEDRIDFIAGDFQEDPFSGSYDVAWLSHVLHGEDEEGCLRMLQKTVEALEPDGLLLVQEFILDDSRDQPVFPALFSLNMLVGTPSGKAYSDAEIREMLGSAGLREITRLPMDLPNGAGVICGRR